MPPYDVVHSLSEQLPALVQWPGDEAGLAPRGAIRDQEAVGQGSLAEVPMYLRNAVHRLAHQRPEAVHHCLGLLQEACQVVALSSLQNLTAYSISVM